MQFALGKGGGGGKEMFLRLFVTKTVRVDFPENPLCSYTLLMYYRYTAIHSPFQLARSKLSPEFIIVSSGLAPPAMYSFASHRLEYTLVRKVFADLMANPILLVVAELSSRALKIWTKGCSSGRRLNLVCSIMICIWV